MDDTLSILFSGLAKTTPVEGLVLPRPCLRIIIYIQTSYMRKKGRLKMISFCSRILSLPPTPPSKAFATIILLSLLLFMKDGIGKNNDEAAIIV